MSRDTLSDERKCCDAPFTLRRRADVLVRFVALLVMALGAAQSASAAILVCRNGDRIRGTVVTETEAEILLETENFGSVRVARTRVVSIESEDKQNDMKPARAADAPKASSREPASDAARRWKGRAAVTIDRTRSAGHQDSLAVDLRLQREWSRDEVRLEANYDFRRDQQRRNADTLKASTQWVHRVSDRYFGSYRASTEWNRSIVYADRDASYLLLQQEFGAGVAFAVASGRRIRVGVSQNFFNLWTSPDDFTAAGNNESVFAELEWSLPWDTRLIERGVGYYSFKHHAAGVENTIELTRRLSKTVSLSIRHDLREDVPDVRLQDHNNLRLLLGYDF